MRTVGIMGVGFTAIAAAAGAGGVAPANYIVTTAAEMVTASTAATSGQVIEVTANITAAVTGTRLTFNPGVTIRADGVNVRTLSGYAARFNCNGNYTPCVIESGIDWDATGCNPVGSFNGSIQCDKGYLIFKGTLRGNNGQASGTRPGNGVCVTANATTKGMLELVGATVYGAAADCVSGYNLDNAGVTVAPGSYITAVGCTIRTPGTGGTDNLVTSHDGFYQIVSGGLIGPGGGGPMINCAPVTSRSECWGVTFDMTGASSASNDLHMTVAVGCKFINNGANVRQLYIHGDAATPSSPSIAAYNEGINVVAYNDNTVPAMLLGNVNAGSNSWFGNYQPLGTTVGVITAQNNFNGQTGSTLGTLMTVGSSESYNDTIDVPSGAAGATYPIRTFAPSSGSQVTQVFSAWINPSARATLAYATRSDTANTSITIKDTRSKATTAIGFGTFAPTNCTINDTTPSGASVGASNACAELVAKPWYSGLTTYRAGQPAIGAGGWATNLKTLMGV